MIYLSGFSGMIGGGYCLCVYIFSIMTKSRSCNLVIPGPAGLSIGGGYCL